MSCTSPIPAIDLGIDKNTGKHLIKIKYPRIGESFEEFKHKYEVDGSSKVIMLPCGHCIACMLSRRREWAIRCAMEAKYYDKVSFITLTYDDEHCPDHLVKSHFQEFIKALRNDGHQVRYFGCGEYGETTHRPHYHVIVFNYFPSDCRNAFTSLSDKAVFVSEELENYWKYGMSVVQYFDPKCGSYVAGYTGKKLGQEDSFIMMSKRPGLGYKYLLDHKLDIAQFYKIVDDFGSMKSSKPPRYFDKICEQENIDLSSIKEDIAEFSRIARAVQYQRLKVDHINDIFENQEYFDFRKFARLKRS